MVKYYIFKLSISQTLDLSIKLANTRNNIDDNVISAKVSSSIYYNWIQLKLRVSHRLITTVQICQIDLFPMFNRKFLRIEHALASRMCGIGNLYNRIGWR